MEDGVIKYSLEFFESDPIEWSLCNDIESIREDLYQLGLIGVYSNGIGYGNISQLVDSESGQFVITGTQTGDKDKLEAKDYALITNIDIDTFKTVSTGSTKPSSESITHAAIYQLDSSIGAVIHIHSESLWNFMLKSNKYIATSDVEYGSIEMVKDIVNIYSNKSALEYPSFVMKGHFEGIVTFGTDLKEAQKVLYSIVDDYLRNSVSM
jgi:ribulose-5-phosphate 4-epimerase/fuculose-1-phosphate aldolase